MDVAQPADDRVGECGRHHVRRGRPGVPVETADVGDDEGHRRGDHGLAERAQEHGQHHAGHCDTMACRGGGGVKPPSSSRPSSIRPPSPGIGVRILDRMGCTPQLGPTPAIAGRRPFAAPAGLEPINGPFPCACRERMRTPCSSTATGSRTRRPRRTARHGPAGTPTSPDPRARSASGPAILASGSRAPESLMSIPPAPITMAMRLLSMFCR